MDDSRYKRLRDADHRHLWHPFTQMRAWMADEAPLIVERGEGNWLIDVNGQHYLDGVSSLWCNVHGHRKPALDAALQAQLGKIAHSTMLGMANVPAIELARELIAIAPPGLTRVFYSDSGAEAVEVALRMAAQYWQLCGAPRRTRFLTLTESYHGDTVGAVSLGYSEIFHRHAKPLLFPVLKVDPPHLFRFQRGMDARAAEAAALAAASDLIVASRGELAALVVEPMMQGAAGMWNHSADYLRALTQLARAAGALVIFDEVAVGFGRTGKMFACEHAGLAPDLMCLGKGITGGYLPLAATLASERIFEAFLGEPHEFRAFYYGHTYTGNPLAAAAALANLGVFRDERVIERIQPLIERMNDGLAQLFGGHPRVADIRQTGLMAGIEVMEDPKSRSAYPSRSLTGARIARAARNRGVAIRPLSDVIVLMPPLSIAPNELDLLLATTRAALDEVTSD
ncbi:MAG TPA: adenosylmethionine--8-amino-7-oxononanoate transaminase [Candidatus Binataceae bacterium]|nr:adenosylmethionine--8-amino-7-oxononanoate transaminase [Candidatus Binataceae bacterium]